MAIKNFLVGLEPTHLWLLDNEQGGTIDTDLGSGDDTGAYELVEGAELVEDEAPCLGMKDERCLKVIESSTQNSVWRIPNTGDINDTNNAYTKRSVCFWMKMGSVGSPTIMYKQGGGARNFAFLAGIGNLITWQAAAAGQPFLIAHSKFQLEEGRSYFVVGIWEFHTEHSGSGNRVLLYINGVLQEVVELDGTGVFARHTGAINLGNQGPSGSGELQSYNDNRLTFVTSEKYASVLGMFNDKSLTQAECREIYERMVRSEDTIEAGTVAEQQAALDLLKDKVYGDVNCAIRIYQAMDAVNYRLFLDNVTFNPNSDKGSIDVQFVGAGELTIENCNGSNASVLSTPAEVDIDGGTDVRTGGGSVELVNGALLVGNVGSELSDSDLGGIVNRLIVRSVETSGQSWTLKDVIIGELEYLDTAEESTVLISGSTIGDIVDDGDKLTVGVGMKFTGLPAGREAVVGFWLVSDGLESGRSGMTTVSVADTEATEIVTQLGFGEYYLVVDAFGYRRSGILTFNTSQITELRIGLEEIVGVVGDKLIPTVLTAEEQVQADLIEYDAVDHRIDISANDSVNKVGYRAFVYKLEQIQSAADYLENEKTLQFTDNRVLIDSSALLKLRRKSGIASEYVPDLSAFSVEKLGSNDVQDFVDYSNGALIVNPKEPVAVEATVEAVVDPEVDYGRIKDDVEENLGKLGNLLVTPSD